jgi:hypothetical protein
MIVEGSEDWQRWRVVVGAADSEHNLNLDNMTHVGHFVRKMPGHRQNRRIGVVALRQEMSLVRTYSAMVYLRRQVRKIVAKYCLDEQAALGGSLDQGVHCCKQDWHWQ